LERLSFTPPPGIVTRPERLCIDLGNASADAPPRSSPWVCFQRVGGAMVSITDTTP
jgi:hypothetical protein